MTRTSRRYAQEVTDRIDRVIQSIRSTSPVLRSSTILRSSSPVIRTSSPIRTEYIYSTPVTAVNEIYRIDNTCRSLIAENDLLRDQVYIQNDLIEENTRVHRDLNKVALENDILRSENRKVNEYEHKVNSLLKQSQDVSIQLGQTTREASTWRARFDEADVNGARYRNLYQNALSDNERLKAEIVDLRNSITKEGLLKMEISRLLSQNEDLASLRLRLSQELVSKNEENIQLRVNLKEVDVLSAKLSLCEQDNRKLREVISSQNDSAVEMRRRIEDLNIQITQLKVELSVIPGLEEKISYGNRTSETLTRMISEKESVIVSLHKNIANLQVEINQLNVEVSSIAVLEEKIALANRGSEALTRMLNEKENQINSLHRNMSSLEVEISGLNKEISHLNIAVDQNAMYRSELDRLHSESDSLKLKVARLIDVEQKLLLSQKDRETLNSSLSSRLETIRELNLRIAHLEEQMTALEQLKSKVVLVVSENERLNQSVVDQARIILEWSEKYYNLEKLYLTVKETTEHLEVVKNRFQRAVKETEVTHANLRNSTYTVTVKGGDLYQSRYSSNSEARTAGSPTDLLASPFAVGRSNSRTASPGRV